MAASRKVIDVHAHVTPQRFQEVVLAGDHWHGMTADDGELDNLVNRWKPERRIEEMDRLGSTSRSSRRPTSSTSTTATPRRPP